MTALKNIMANFHKYKFLMSQLILRDFKIKYKRSVLGVVWSLLYPILILYYFLARNGNMLIVPTTMRMNQIKIRFPHPTTDTAFPKIVFEIEAAM